MMNTRYKKKVEGSFFNYPLSIIRYKVNSLGKPPKIQLIGLTTMYDPTIEVDITITSCEYLKVSNPKGMMKMTSKKIRDQIE